MVSEVSKDIHQTFGSAFISRSQVSQYLGLCKQKTAEFCSPLPVYESGKKLLYFKGDIARAMDELRTYRPFGA